MFHAASDAERLDDVAEWTVNVLFYKNDPLPVNLHGNYHFTTVTIEMDGMVHYFAFRALAFCFMTFFGLDISAVTPLALPGSFFTLDVSGGFLALVDLGRFVISHLLAKAA